MDGKPKRRSKSIRKKTGAKQAIDNLPLYDWTIERGFFSTWTQKKLRWQWKRGEKKCFNSSNIAREHPERGNWIAECRKSAKHFSIKSKLMWRRWWNVSCKKRREVERRQNKFPKKTDLGLTWRPKWVFTSSPILFSSIARFHCLRASRKLSRNWKWRSDKRRHQLPTVMTVWIGLEDGKCLFRVELSLVVPHHLDCGRNRFILEAITQLLNGLCDLNRSMRSLNWNRRREWCGSKAHPAWPERDANSWIRSHVLYELLPGVKDET